MQTAYTPEISSVLAPEWAAPAASHGTWRPRPAEWADRQAGKADTAVTGRALVDTRKEYGLPDLVDLGLRANP